ncbi:hypothetical protein [uncultured Nocardioides sp.]|uniref:hypothetical protein n=1 Tax=uncultured Nocardioides sp. TaxID=198441 RepID=UPI0025F38C00|nr:hypothetical protein [uncultured Nocardioides sp.]
MRRVNSSTDTVEVLGEVASGVIELGFGAVAISEVDGAEVVVTHVQGPPGVAEAILGDRDPADDMRRAMDGAEHWGILRFMAHDRVPQWLRDSVV